LKSDVTSSGRREPNAAQVNTRRVTELLRPFVGRFDDWNRRAARASATALSHVTTAAEKVHHQRKLRELYHEVESAYEEFEQVVAGEGYHSRIEDVRSAFRRLRGVLGDWR
jgi:hypothetical protein